MTLLELDSVGVVGVVERRVGLTLRRAGRVLLDLAVLTSALVLAFALRFDGEVPLFWQKRMLVMLPWVLLVQYLALVMLDVPRCSWRHVSLREVQRIGVAAGLAGGVLLTLRLVAPHGAVWLPVMQHSLLPIGAIAADGLLALLGLAAVRGAWRMLDERSPSVPIGSASRVLLVGAGDIGAQVARELQRRPEFMPVGFLDDDPDKRGSVIHGVTVLGPTTELERRCRELHVDEVLIAAARVGGRFVRRVSESAKALALPVRIVPGLGELVDGQVALAQLRPVALEDLLRREPVHLDEQGIAASLRGRVVLVTGAGGSIGSELCRQLCRFGPRRLLLLERSENALFEIHGELGRRFPSRVITPLLVDVSERQQLHRVFERERPDLVFHAAAHKHVPMLEWNPSAAVINNVVGTAALAELAAEFEAEAFVLVSTDKAVRPRSIMGASKRCGELLVHALAQAGLPTRFMTVRFGNVLGSNGSVVPTFERQIAALGPVTVTHPDMERYFMTVPEATQLVLQAAAIGEGGEVFILDMGEPVKIVDLAEDMIRLSGLVPGEDVTIEFTGLRPGEKLREELSCAGELLASAHPAIRVERRAWTLHELDRGRLRRELDALIDAARAHDEPAIRQAFQRLIPEAELLTEAVATSEQSQCA
ncbi:polysaccharide biosynthesis protein [Nannocystaceae bacterium ST9]